MVDRDVKVVDIPYKIEYDLFMLSFTTWFVDQFSFIFLTLLHEILTKIVVHIMNVINQLTKVFNVIVTPLIVLIDLFETFFVID